MIYKRNNMPSGGRRLPRTMRNSLPTMLSNYTNEVQGNRYSSVPSGLPTLPPMEQPPAPKHIPFPTTPVDSDLFFEAMMCFYTIVCTMLQYLHLYRSVWWLPHSYTNHAVNFYLIDVHLVIFIILILSRRLLYVLGCQLIINNLPLKSQDVAYFWFRLTLFFKICMLLFICAYFVMKNHPFVNILYLCYPVLVYFILFGHHITPIFELTNWSSSCFPPLHACSSNAVHVRKEVENLKLNFNNRMKQILFSSIINAYYAGFIPCCFAQTALHYDKLWATQHVIFIFASCFVAFTIQILSLRYCDILHRSALHLGNWDKLETRHMLLVNNNWKEETLWPCGTLVRHMRDIYRATGECNASEPGNSSFTRFYTIFINPSYSLSILLAFQTVIVILQLLLLIRCSLWYNIVSLSFMLFFNYYVLYKLARDYLISFRIYKEEKIMHAKSVIR
ncbi:transmembrane protein 39A-A [Aethina tumida]|uniref:transmembrane protein 39A-A n=1 Tax=Aethina tumida TaxID=116153 RepID=UPI00096B1B3B|nr:transmembrane protein 39A-A [Aethina tumida]